MSCPMSLCALALKEAHETEYYKVRIWELVTKKEEIRYEADGK
jgi:hypothetical protein